MYELKVDGMTCGGCAASVKRALQALDAKANVDVDLPSKIGKWKPPHSLMRSRTQSRMPATTCSAQPDYFGLRNPSAVPAATLAEALEIVLRQDDGAALSAGPSSHLKLKDFSRSPV